MLFTVCKNMYTQDLKGVFYVNCYKPGITLYALAPTETYPSKQLHFEALFQPTLALESQCLRFFSVTFKWKLRSSFLLYFFMFEILQECGLA